MNNLHISLTEMRNESRVLKQTNSIINNNIAANVYIASLHADDLSEEYKYNDRLFLKRFKLSTRKLSNNFFVQTLKYIEFFFRVFFYYKNKDIKIVNIHTIDLLPLGVLLKYFYGSILVYDTHELETEVDGSKGFRKKIYKFVEKTLIRRVDLVFVVGENISKWYHNTYNINKPKAILNVPKLFKIQKTNKFREVLGIKDDSIIVLYQGALSKGRGVDLLLESFKLRNDDKIVVVFMGYGDFEEDVKYSSNNYNNIFYHTAVAPEIVLTYTSSADFGIHVIKNTCLNHYYCLPNKFFEYSMAGLPVIVSNMKEMKEMVEKYNMGIVAEKESIDSINKAIDEILRLDIEQMKKNARRCAEENAWEMQEEKMINEYRRILKDKFS